MARAIGYIRVSTGKQVESGASLAAQRAKIEAYALAKDLDLVEIIEDAGLSAKNLNRPGMQRVIDMASRREIDAIIILKLDRMFRSTIDGLETIELFQKKGVALHSIQESLDMSSPAGEFAITILLAFGRMERRQVSIRTKTAMAQKKAEGKVIGPTPYGYDRIGKDLVPNEREQAVLARMRELRESGETYQAIADTLNSEGVQSKKGAAWGRAQVFKILGNAA